MSEPASSKLNANETLKEGSPTLSGTIAQTLADPATDRFSEDDIQFLKFHGIYQQDDRDLRKTGKQYMMMVRGRIPGGVMTSRQWQAFDTLASSHGNNSLRLTTRQSIQFHGVLKSHLGSLIKGINECLLSTLAGCGDVNRNVMAPPTPAFSKVRDEVFQDCRQAADALKPSTRAYHSIWLEGVPLNLENPADRDFVDPLYGKLYLPRKFKTAFVVPPINDIDVLTNDIGFIAIVENDQRVGYNISVGGGMGRSHGNTATYPRLADVIGFVRPEQVVAVARAVLTIHRDFGDRTDRKHARLKYVVAEKGVEWTRSEIERRMGLKFEPARPFHFTTTGDLYGWHRQVDGCWFLTLFVETGRVKDDGAHRLKTALRKIADGFPTIEFRLSPNQNVILANVGESDKKAITTLLADHGVRTEGQTSVLHAASLACPSLPTCGLALAESERVMPALIDRLEILCSQVGLAGEEIIVRMTGCPNGCARPYMAEIAFVGKAPGRYQVWLGGNAAGTRLNRIWKDMVKDGDIENELRPVLARYAQQREGGERFGDWCERVFWKENASAAN